MALTDVRHALKDIYQLTLVGPDLPADPTTSAESASAVTTSSGGNYEEQPQLRLGVAHAINLFQRYRIKWEAEVQESLHFVLLRHWLDAYTQGKAELLITPEDAAEVLGVRYSAGPSTELRRRVARRNSASHYHQGLPNCSPLSRKRACTPGIHVRDGDFTCSPETDTESGRPEAY